MDTITKSQLVPILSINVGIKVRELLLEELSPVNHHPLNSKTFSSMPIEEHCGIFMLLIDAKRNRKP